MKKRTAKDYSQLTTESFNEMDTKELINANRKMAKALHQRERRLTQATKNNPFIVVDNNFKVPSEYTKIKGMSKEELINATDELSQLMNNPTTTITGLKVENARFYLATDNKEINPDSIKKEIKKLDKVAKKQREKFLKKKLEEKKKKSKAKNKKYIKLTAKQKAKALDEYEQRERQLHPHRPIIFDFMKKLQQEFPSFTHEITSERVRELIEEHMLKHGESGLEKEEHYKMIAERLSDEYETLTYERQEKERKELEQFQGKTIFKM